MEKKKQFYVTTSIAYVNAPPHLGHAMELAQADVLARYHRLRGEEVFFLTGTDEHGKKVAEAAAKNGMEPRVYVDMISSRFDVLCKELGISDYHFIRTSDQTIHMPVVTKMWRNMVASGDIYKGEYEGRYCVGCEAFLREAEIDEEGKCHIHKKETQAVREENYFFKFSKYAKKAEQLIREDVFRIIPEFRKKEALNLFSEEGVRDFSVSRPRASVEWGIPVSDDHHQLIYVWVDALMNYVSGAGYGTDDFKKRWPPDVQVIGKDILRFHAMMWPAFLLACGFSEEDLPKKLAVHGHISIEGQKMSKSLGNVVDPMALIQKYGTETVRYYLLREMPSDDDGDFSFARFEERYTADLQNGLGNLVSRVTVMAVANPEAVKDIRVSGAAARTKDIYKKYASAIDTFQLHRALEQVWMLIEQSNKIVEDMKLWELAARDGKKANEVFIALAHNFAAIAYMLAPFLPETAEKIATAIGTDVVALAGDADISVRFQKPAQLLFPRLNS